jgi:hypothetical protein
MEIEGGAKKTTYMDLLLRRLWTSFVLESKEFGAMTSWPSTLRKVVENRPNSLTNKTCKQNYLSFHLPTCCCKMHLVINHNKISNIEDMSGENKKELEGTI